MLLVNAEHVDAVLRVEIELQRFEQAVGDFAFTAVEVVNKDH